MAVPQINPGDIAGWPMLKIVYRTDPEKIADLLPPGLEPGANPHVHVNVYNVPVKGEPEYGVSTKVEADYRGVPGYYGIGLGIDQESAIFISQELNGQPKFPCSIAYFRRDDAVVARCTHQGYTFLEFTGVATGAVEEDGAEREEHDWWTKYSRAVGGVEKSYDFAPHVVDVASRVRTVRAEAVDGTLVLRDSPWDPYTTLLPMREQLSAQLVWSASTSRTITLAGPLDPIAFWPYADTIGGSRWPGLMGGPRPG
ncbi:MAG TPA: acetoacetate decarboxylase family protein [Acidimicrobiia bacterium]|nr:acetoacetate decarboxylase family protein [Acidimicrobiia bacterium]